MENQKPKKKSSRRGKGKYAETLCKQIFKDHGYLVEIKNYSKWTGKDFFSWFDFIAVKKNYVEFVQVKSNDGDFNKAIRGIKKWKIENKLNLFCSVWLYLGDSIWRVDNLDKNPSKIYIPKNKKWTKNRFKNEIFVDNLKTVLKCSDSDIVNENIDKE